MQETATRTRTTVQSGDIASKLAADSSQNCSAANSDDRLSYEGTGPAEGKSRTRTQYKRADKEEVIVDATGTYVYDVDPVGYMKARKRQQNRDSATRTRQRKESYILQLEEQLQIAGKENEDLKIRNASLVAENELLKSQVAYFQDLVARTHTPTQEEIPCGEPLFEDKHNAPPEDTDYVFLDPEGRENVLSPSTLLATVTFGLLCVVSFFVGNNGDSASQDTSTGHGLKSVDGTVFGWTRTLLSPYFLLLAYMMTMSVLVLWNERSWTKRKLRQVLKKLRFHSKNSQKSLPCVCLLFRAYTDFPFINDIIYACYIQKFNWVSNAAMTLLKRNQSRGCCNIYYILSLMGTCSTADRNSAVGEITAKHYDFRWVIGKGGFGKVWRARGLRDKKNYAIKVLNKAKIIHTDSVPAIMNERRLLAKLDSPFIAKIAAAFQDPENLYLVLDLMPGGDLRSYARRVKSFTEAQAKFIIGCVMCGLEYLHTKGVVHRDIKPANLVIDEEGYVRITDFGISVIMAKEAMPDTSGTPGYMAPEVIWKRTHGVAVDYFALGVVAYELMMQKRPYKGRNRHDCQYEIWSKEVKLTKSTIPEGWSAEAADFINKCLHRKPAYRLGVHGPNEVKQHIWLRDVNWALLSQKKIPSPLEEQRMSAAELKMLEDEPDPAEEKIKAELAKGGPAQKHFAGYYFDGTKEESTSVTCATTENREMKADAQQQL